MFDYQYIVWILFKFCMNNDQIWDIHIILSRYFQNTVKSIKNIMDIWLSSNIAQILPTPCPNIVQNIKISYKTLTTGCPTKKFTLFKPVYLRPLISLRKSSVLERNLWISSFKNTNSKFSRILVFRDIKGIRYHSRFSGYSWPTFVHSEITNYFEMARIWPKMIIIQV